ncbi:efflux RND transporter periplasmic adaptor subunit [Thiorhodovibrio frisius]|uniref:RND family efflux transporter, MFP subunit n=1 Tax=Thiorhodovibrio frisius TaxID=631362 RepID=H8YZJ6_9GAMM|nr:HlyD family secretion protein [Thiorhodovibrio frisius]EIC22123.1 RND family efflux transporter, MFP subunit [Thiorhodovibrio frisius]WPL24416.1 p-hydroxybenzoic acid efflux pump subunit AaeA [Thiorhodovibrio frisius]
MKQNTVPVSEAETQPETQTESQPVRSEPAPPRRKNARWQVPRSVPDSLRVLVTLAMVAIACAALFWAWHSQRGHPWTRDGQVLGRVIGVAPQVSGPVIRVAVSDNQPVRAGDLLFELDPRLYQLAFAEAEADLTQARAEADTARADLVRAGKQHQSGELADEAYQLKIAVSELASAALAAAQTRLDTAQLQLKLTRITAPVNGYVTNLTLNLGQYAKAGVVQLALIEQESFWVTAYFKETDLAAIPIGAPAAVTLMGYPKRPLRGEVESIAHGIARRNQSDHPSGLAEVSPTFEWIRLAQRIPVRIRLLERPADVPLRIGTTASLAILPASAADKAAPASAPPNSTP